ncbi:MAG: hypothetical protein AAF614_39525 [Chloroflexota bacterium]
MSKQTVTLSLSNEMYERFRQVANSTQQPLEAVVIQSLESNLPPSIEDVPAEWQEEFSQLSSQSSEALMVLVNSSAPVDLWKRHEYLLYQNQEGAISELESQELTNLRDDMDRFVLKRSYASALLKWRGIAVLDNLSHDIAT